MDESRVKLMLVDDHRVVRMGLASLLGTQEQFCLVGEAGTVAEAVAEARRCQPDVILMDLRLPDGSGVEACRQIRSDLPNTRVLMLTSYADDEAVVSSIVAGASGYFLKQSDPDGLVEAVATVARGGSLIDPVVTRAVVGWMQRQSPQPAQSSPMEGLSEQERKILPLIAEGKTNREIASQLFLSEHTVKTYVSNILRKLNLTRRSEAAAFIARRSEAAAFIARQNAVMA
jgi:two-component system, NarL family, response regulator DevR